MGSYEKSKIEDLLKLDGQNLSSCSHKTSQIKAQELLGGFLIIQGPELVPRLK